MDLVSRRTFVKGLATGGAVTAFGGWPQAAFAQPGQLRSQETLRGTAFDLAIGETRMNFTGSPKVALTINGSVPGPLLRWREGDTISLRVRNELDEDTSIHWHGLILPANMDGVPGLSFHGIRPRETYHYTFTVKQAGTYWYHSHSGFQEQRGVYGPIVIDPRARIRSRPIASTSSCSRTGPTNRRSACSRGSRNNPITTTSTSARSATSSRTCGHRACRARSPIGRRGVACA